MTTLVGTYEPDDRWVAEPGQLPMTGDLIVMEAPREAPLPPGWTRGGSVAWKFSDGTETSFPWRACWFSGYEPIA